MICLGNVWEWCFDYWNDSYYGDSLVFINPVILVGKEEEDRLIRAHRGGHWGTSLYRCAARHPGIIFRPQSNGFRCAMTIKPKK
jgi:formylglycine-generating enzyme required for sulfatase activity